MQLGIPGAQSSNLRGLYGVVYTQRAPSITPAKGPPIQAFARICRCLSGGLPSRQIGRQRTIVCDILNAGWIASPYTSFGIAGADGLDNSLELAVLPPFLMHHDSGEHGQVNTS